MQKLCKHYDQDSELAICNDSQNLVTFSRTNKAAQQLDSSLRQLPMTIPNSQQLITSKTHQHTRNNQDAQICMMASLGSRNEPLLSVIPSSAILHCYNHCNVKQTIKKVKVCESTVVLINTHGTLLCFSPLYMAWQKIKP